MKKLLACFAAGLACVTFSACGSFDDGYGTPEWGNSFNYDIINGNPDGGFVHESIVEQDFTSVKEEPSSYFSLDRNTASYAHVRYEIENGHRVDSDSVRIEELINYFDYGYAAPEDKPVAVSTALAPCPWNADNKLMLVGLKTTEYISEANANYVFLIDVSGSMSGDNRLGLAKKGFNLLLDSLGENDLVSVVTYASGVKTVLDGKECTDDGKEKIREEINDLRASGATSGGDGLERAYRIAQKHFIKGGNNRVIIISDGDFNVGISKTDDLKEFIQTKAESGVYLSVIGVGMGNMRDDMLETLATCGNGNYAYLDNYNEARKVFVDELQGNLFTVAKDAKAGVKFTEAVDKYRLVGYDTKRISAEDFDDERADTGEIGSNLCVTALYEIGLSDGSDGKLADVEIRYKNVNDDEKNESVTSEINTATPATDDLAFVSCVAEFGLVLRQSKYMGTSSLTAVLERLDGLSEYIKGDIYKQEFVTLVGKASEMECYK